MERILTFAEILEAVGRLPYEDQVALTEIVRRRAAEEGRRRLLAEVAESGKEFEEGEGRVVTPDELMDEILR